MSEDAQRWHVDAFTIGTIYDGTDPDAVSGLGSMTDYLERATCDCDDERVSPTGGCVCDDLG